jgi:hypothetical protein
MLTVPGSTFPAGCPRLRQAPILAPLALLCALVGPEATASPAPLAAAAAATPAETEGLESAEDRGFAIVLKSPVDPWLHGRREIRIEAIIPRDDKVEQVDFFVDRHLVFVDTDEPYSTTFEFGPEIRRHTVEVKALTHEGRRARLSFVSRTADLSENAPGRVVTLTAMVRDTAGRPIDRLDVSDFTVIEGTERQGLVHFQSGPGPATLAVVVDPLAKGASQEALGRFVRQMPSHQAVARFGVSGTVPVAPEPLKNPATNAAVAAAKLDKNKPQGAAGKETPPPRDGPSPFTYDTGPLLASFEETTTPPEADVVPAEARAVNRRPHADPAPPYPLALSQAAAAIGARRGSRLILLVAAVAPIGDEPLGPPVPASLKEGTLSGKTAAGAAAATAAGHAGGAAGTKGEPEPDPFTEAIDAARKSGAALHVIALPAPRDLTWSEAKAAAHTLRAAAEESGGAYDEAFDAAAMERALAGVAERMRHQYVLSYVREGAAGTGFKPLQVEVRGHDRTIEAPRSIYLGD